MTGKIWGFELSLPPGELVVGIGDGDSGETAARLEEGGDWQCDKHGGVDDDVAFLFPPVPRLVGLDRQGRTAHGYSLAHVSNVHGGPFSRQT